MLHSQEQSAFLEKSNKSARTVQDANKCEWNKKPFFVKEKRTIVSRILQFYCNISAALTVTCTWGNGNHNDDQIRRSSETNAQWWTFREVFIQIKLHGSSVQACSLHYTERSRWRKACVYLTAQQQSFHQRTPSTPRSSLWLAPQPLQTFKRQKMWAHSVHCALVNMRI